MLHLRMFQRQQYQGKYNYIPKILLTSQDPNTKPVKICNLTLFLNLKKKKLPFCKMYKTSLTVKITTAVLSHF